MSQLASVIMAGLSQGSQDAARAMDMARLYQSLQDAQQQGAWQAEDRDYTLKQRDVLQEDRVRALAERQASQDYLTRRANDLGVFVTRDPLTGNEQSDTQAADLFARMDPSLQRARVDAAERSAQAQRASADRFKLDQLRNTLRQGAQARRIAAIEEYRPKFGDEWAEREMARASGVVPPSAGRAGKPQADPFERMAQFRSLVDRMGPGAINPQYVPMLEQAFIDGDMPTTLWNKALQNNTSRGSMAAARANLEFHKALWSDASRKARDAGRNADYDPETFARASAEEDAAREKWSEAVRAYERMARGAEAEPADPAATGPLEPGDLQTAPDAGLSDELIDQAIDEMAAQGIDVDDPDNAADIERYARQLLQVRQQKQGVTP